jgi:hypothetical protein
MAWCSKPKANWIFLCITCEDKKASVEERILGLTNSGSHAQNGNQSTDKQNTPKKAQTNPPLFVSSNGTIHILQAAMESPPHALSSMSVFPANRCGSCVVCQTAYSSGAIVQGYKVFHLPNDRWVVQCYPRCAKIELGLLTTTAPTTPSAQQDHVRTPPHSPLKALQASKTLDVENQHDSSLDPFPSSELLVISTERPENGDKDRKRQKTDK